MDVLEALSYGTSALSTKLARSTSYPDHDIRLCIWDEPWTTVYTARLDDYIHRKPQKKSTLGLDLTIR